MIQKKFSNGNRGLYCAAMAALLMASCTKTTNTTTTNNSTVPPTSTAYTINGLKDMTLVNNSGYQGTSNTVLTIQYGDSAQENVSLSLSALPAGITMDNTWTNSGIPSFSTTLSLFDTTAPGAKPGTYPMTLTATTASGKTKNYPFNIKVLPIPAAFYGKYNSCVISGTANTTYSDSVYADPNMPNKVWFSNFLNTGSKVYAIVTYPSTITIPPQLAGTDSVSAAPLSDVEFTHNISLNNLRVGYYYKYLNMN